MFCLDIFSQLTHLYEGIHRPVQEPDDPRTEVILERRHQQELGGHRANNHRLASMFAYKFNFFQSYTQKVFAK